MLYGRSNVHFTGCTVQLSLTLCISSLFCVHVSICVCHGVWDGMGMCNMYLSLLYVFFFFSLLAQEPIYYSATTQSSYPLSSNYLPYGFFEHASRVESWSQAWYRRWVIIVIQDHQATLAGSVFVIQCFFSVSSTVQCKWAAVITPCRCLCFPYTVNYEWW